MTGSAQRRFCEACSTHVHDLSSLTERQAEALLADHRGRSVCVRYRYDAAGRVEFRTEPRAVSFIAAMSLAMAACTGYADPEQLEGPDDAMVCRDVSGYAIDCTQLREPNIPELEGDLEEGVEGGVVGGVVGGVSGVTMGAMVTGVEIHEGECLLPHPATRSQVGGRGPGGPEADPVMTRRERRRAARRARRARRALLGRVVPD